MSSISWNLHLLWFGLIPIAALFLIIPKLHQINLAHARGLIQPYAYKRINIAIRAGWLYALFVVISYFYETAIVPPVAGLGIALFMIWLLKSAESGIHPAVRGFLQPIPGDGLLAIMPEKRLNKFKRITLRGLLMIPFILLLFAVLNQSVPLRMSSSLLLGVAFIAPAMVIPYRRLVLLPLLLAGLALFIGFKALALRNDLPAGNWTTPITVPNCTFSLAGLPDGNDWCINTQSGNIKRVSLDSGIVRAQFKIDRAFHILATNEEEAWVLRHPPNRVMRLREDETTPITIRGRLWHIRQAAIDSKGTLWMLNLADFNFICPEINCDTAKIDEDEFLALEGSTVEVSPDGSIWFGSQTGVIQLSADNEVRHLIRSNDGWQGPIIDFAFGKDDTVWFLWGESDLSASSAPSWGVSRLETDGTLQPINLSSLTQLHLPQSKHGLVIDGEGRPWFLAYSQHGTEKFLGILTADGGEVSGIYSLGSFNASGGRSTLTWANTSYDAPGITSDGAGGVYLFNGPAFPIRHWQPTFFQLGEGGQR